MSAPTDTPMKQMKPLTSRGIAEGICESFVPILAKAGVTYAPSNSVDTIQGLIDGLVDRELSAAQAEVARADKMRGDALLECGLQEERANRAEAIVAREKRISDDQMMGLLRRRVMFLEAEVAREKQRAESNGVLAHSEGCRAEGLRAECARIANDYWPTSNAEVEPALDEMRAAVKTLAESATAPAPGWRPIEEAPDNAPLLLYGRNGSGELRRVIGGKNIVTGKWQHGFAFEFHPTHWQPLPPPPNQAKG